MPWSGRTPARSRASTSSPPRAGGADRFADVTGLPLATYFSASKVAWILDNVPGARAAAEAGELLFGTPDTWVVWNLTGGRRGGIHVTDVTNASRTLLMDLRTLDWSDELLEVVGHPAVDDARDPVLLRGRRRGGAARRRRRTADRGHPRRSAGGDLRPGRLRRRRVEEHVRHRQLPARQHRHRHRPLGERSHHHRRVPVCRRTRPLRARGVDRGDGLARAVAARQPRHHPALGRRRVARLHASTTTAGPTSSRPSRDCSLRTGARTRAGPWSGSRAS